MANGWDFETRGLDEIIDAFNRAPTEARVVLNDGLREIGRLFVPSKGAGPLAQATPKGESGRLANSTFFEISAPGVDQFLVIKQPARTPDIYGGDFYGVWVRGGTRPHRIAPRYKSWLKFKITDSASGAETTVFSKGVNHPGTAPNPYHIRVFNQLKPRVQAVVERMGVRIATIFNTGVR